MRNQYGLSDEDEGITAICWAGNEEQAEDIFIKMGETAEYISRCEILETSITIRLPDGNQWPGSPWIDD